MRKMNFLFILMVAVVLGACNKNSDSSNGGDGGKFPAKIPDAISQKPEQGQALTQEQKATFLQMMVDSVVVSAPELIVPAANETYQDQQERQKRFNESTLATKDFGNLLKQRCIIKPGTERVDGQLQNPGDATVRTSNRTLNGAGCPVEWSLNDVANTTFVSADQQTGLAIVNFEANQGSDFKLVDSSLSSQIKITATKVNSHAIGRMELSQAGLNSYVMIDTNSSATTTDGETIAVKGSGEMLLKGNLQNSKITLNYSFRGVQYVLSMIQTRYSNGQAERHTYLNGEQIEDGIIKINSNNFRNNYYFEISK